MIFDLVPFAEINESHLFALIDEKIEEQQRIDYKSSLPNSKIRESKEEFLRDISSFANAVGGYLVYGVEEKNGIPIKICGIKTEKSDDPEKEEKNDQTINLEKTIQGLESIIRSGIRPRVTVQTRAISIKDAKHVIIIRIPPSWSKPHQVMITKAFEFHTRHSNGKAQMDIDELRSTFLFGNSIIDKVRAFRDERLKLIAAGETPVSILGVDAKIVLHSIPLETLNGGVSFDIGSLESGKIYLQPIRGGIDRARFNLDGFLTYTTSSRAINGTRREIPTAYVQAFRNGAIESVDTRTLHYQDGELYLPQTPIEKYLIEAVENYFQFQKALGIEPPIVLMLSMLQVKGRSIPRDFDVSYEIQTNKLVLPEVLIQSFDVEPGKILRPMFDAVWNSCGFSGSPNYDSSGKWTENRNR